MSRAVAPDIVTELRASLGHSWRVRRQGAAIQLLDLGLTENDSGPEVLVLYLRRPERRAES
jgi:hypothetical protein